jgi:Fur family transcriptional regulator, zinc uptake regulator
LTPGFAMGARQTTIDEQIKRAEQICDYHGAQLTELRRSVLSLILCSEKPATAYQLLDRLRETHKGAVPPTIYRALNFLMAQKLIHKIERLNAFIPCTDTGHPHSVQFLICRECGAVTEIEDRGAVRAVATAARRQGFHPVETIVEIEGTCTACFHPA